MEYKPQIRLMIATNVMAYGDGVVKGIIQEYFNDESKHYSMSVDSHHVTNLLFAQSKTQGLSSLLLCGIKSCPV